MAVEFDGVDAVGCGLPVLKHNYIHELLTHFVQIVCTCVVYMGCVLLYPIQRKKNTYMY